jgi:hypothetical protein
MLNRIIGIFRLDVNTFEEIEHDQSATGQAALVVIIVAIVAGIGSGFGASIQGNPFFSGFIGTLISALVGWVVWSVVSWFIGTSFFGGQADVGEMLRVIGFAQAPQILGIIPCIGVLVGWIWSLIAGFIAIRQGLDLDNTKALLTIIIGFIFLIVVYAIFGIIFGVTGAIFGALTG